jgi:AmmeMemoRadiSam system protein A
MNSIPLTSDEKSLLLNLARRSIELAVNQQPHLQLKMDVFSPALCEDGAAFVTLTENGELRGCIGALEPYQPLVQDVCEHAAAAALEDYRFLPVRPEEVEHLEIEISRLTSPVPLPYDQPGDLLHKLRPGIDGVILKDGARRATFLPQVWEDVPNPAEFLSHLCMKMGAPANLWQKKLLQVSIYEVEEFKEEKI